MKRTAKKRRPLFLVLKKKYNYEYKNPIANQVKNFNFIHNPLKTNDENIMKKLYDEYKNITKIIMVSIQSFFFTKLLILFGLEW